MGNTSNKHKYKCLSENNEIYSDNFDEHMKNARYNHKHNQNTIKKQQQMKEAYHHIKNTHDNNILYHETNLNNKINAFCENVMSTESDIIKFVSKTGLHEYNICTIVCIDYRLFFTSDKLNGGKLKLKHYFDKPGKNFFTSLWIAKKIGYRLFDKSRNLLGHLKISYTSKCEIKDIQNIHNIYNIIPLVHVSYILS
jgi:hypothetical protein